MWSGCTGGTEKGVLFYRVQMDLMQFWAGNMKDELPYSMQAASLNLFPPYYGIYTKRVDFFFVSIESFLSSGLKLKCSKIIPNFTLNKICHLFMYVIRNRWKCNPSFRPPSGTENNFVYSNSAIYTRANTRLFSGCYNSRTWLANSILIGVQMFCTSPNRFWVEFEHHIKGWRITLLLTA